jgi:hypothetical protein
MPQGGQSISRRAALFVSLPESFEVAFGVTPPSVRKPTKAALSRNSSFSASWSIDRTKRSLGSGYTVLYFGGKPGCLPEEAGSATAPGAAFVAVGDGVRPAVTGGG